MNINERQFIMQILQFTSERLVPDNVPDPAVPVILINCTGKTDEDVMREAVLHTYNIDDDSLRLKQTPSEFEKQRGDYPLRREFPAYTVILKGGTRNTRMMLRNLGFKVGEGGGRRAATGVRLKERGQRAEGKSEERRAESKGQKQRAEGREQRAQGKGRRGD
jgi:hypothetical protein